MTNCGLHLRGSVMVFRWRIPALIACKFQRPQNTCSSIVFRLARSGGGCLGVQVPAGGIFLVDWWLDLRVRVDSELRKGLDSFVLLISWRIWLSRNDIIFNSHRITSDALVTLIREEAARWCSVGMKNLAVLCQHLRAYGSIA